MRGVFLIFLVLVQALLAPATGGASAPPAPAQSCCGEGCPCCDTACICRPVTPADHEPDAPISTAPIRGSLYLAVLLGSGGLVMPWRPVGMVDCRVAAMHSPARAGRAQAWLSVWRT